MTSGSRKTTPDLRPAPPRKPGDEASRKTTLDVPAAPPRKPGDEARPGSKQSGEQICPACGGSGRIDEGVCESCAGTGRITAIVGDA